MAWTSPATWTTGQIVSASDLNAQVRDNFTYVLQKPLVAVTALNVGDITTTSASLADIHTSLAGTLTINSGRIEVKSTGVYSHNVGAGMTLAVDVDGVTKWSGIHVLTTYAHVVTLDVPVTGLSVGSHVAKLRWAVASGTATLASNSNSQVSFIMTEI